MTCKETKCKIVTLRYLDTAVLRKTSTAVKLLPWQSEQDVESMPLKSGRFTAKERTFVKHMANTSDQTYAATKAGYKQPMEAGSLLMAKPAIKAEVLRKAEQILRDELLPLALATHKRLLTEANVPAGTQLGAVKLTYDQVLAGDENKADKEPSEMSYDELQRSIDQLKAAQDAIAGQARDVTPDDEPDEGIFG